LPDHCEVGIRACFDPLSLIQVNNLRRAEETDTEPVESACGEGLGRRIGIAGVDSAGEVRAKLLHGAHRTPEHALASAAVVGVRVEETGGVCGVATRD